MSKNKGFTLIEILVVVAIIAILASILLVGLGRVRTQGADARRIADLRIVANALELYANKCGFYPGGIAAGGTCLEADPADWDALEAALQDANIGVQQIPNDPVVGRTYEYARQPDSQGYAMKAILDDTSASVLQNSWDSTGIATPILDCDPGAGHYCIRL